jgi:hypothetical protein
MYAAIHPMLAVGRGRLACLSTPMGKRGQFYMDWHDESAPWRRFKVTAYDCPRIDRGWLEEQKLILGDRWHGQEFRCEFVEAIGQVFDSAAVEAAFSSDEPPLFGPAAAATTTADSTESPLFV